jgi:hypothetical protein
MGPEFWPGLVKTLAPGQHFSGTYHASHPLPPPLPQGLCSNSTPVTGQAPAAVMLDFSSTYMV